MNKKEYKSREYCRDIECIFQRMRDNPQGEYDYAKSKQKCPTCEAYKFHQWLKENGYKIIKEAN